MGYSLAANWSSCEGSIINVTLDTADFYALIMPIQISMNVPPTLMAVLITASIPLDPMYVVVGLDTGWLPMDALVKVRKTVNKHQSLL